MKSLCLVVPKEDGEKVRKKLVAEDLLRTDLKIGSDGNSLLIPISKSIEIGYQIEERDFEFKQSVPKSYKELLDLPGGLEELLPSSLDIIGDIVIFRLPSELEDYKLDIGNAIAKVNNAKTVALDKGVEGDLRMRDLELLVGSDTTTIHKEFGLSFELDLAKVYFSPRLSAEHRRIADNVKSGETIIDMFCGIGPFSIMIAKQRSPKRIYAIDKNPDAIRYLHSNIARNRVDGIVSILGDAKEVVKNIEKADRIIMNLPLSSFEFLDAALSAAKEICTIHYYEVLIKDMVHERIEQLKEKAAKYGKELDANLREVKSYSSTKAHFAFDLSVRG